MHWDTFKQGDYSTMGGDGGCRIGEVQYVFLLQSEPYIELHHSYTE